MRFKGKKIGCQRLPYLRVHNNFWTKFGHSYQFVKCNACVGQCRQSGVRLKGKKIGCQRRPYLQVHHNVWTTFGHSSQCVKCNACIGRCLQSAVRLKGKKIGCQRRPYLRVHHNFWTKLGYSGQCVQCNACVGRCRQSAVRLYVSIVHRRMYYIERSVYGTLLVPRNLGLKLHTRILVCRSVRPQQCGKKKK